jgi:hypothetical protein
LYFKGVGDGLFWANAELLATQGAGQRKEGQLYCTPAIGLDSQNYQSLLDAYLPKLASKMHFPTKTWKSIDDLPVGFVLVLALIDAFPCDKGAQK